MATKRTAKDKKIEAQKAQVSAVEAEVAEREEELAQAEQEMQEAGRKANANPTREHKDARMAAMTRFNEVEAETRDARRRADRLRRDLEKVEGTS